MKLKLIAIDRHRNGVGGAPFTVVLFKQSREPGRKVAILFDAPDHCVVLDVKLLAAGDIAFGSNSWRGDDYEPELRRLIAVSYRAERRPS
ncbi:MAG TPA: hypothetical protein VE988_20645 [Gemmataceae bacterium]|nr:hypothetical protein [Gemmataceae bacterium]